MFNDQQFRGDLLFMLQRYNIFEGWFPSASVCSTYFPSFPIISVSYLLFWSLSHVDAELLGDELYDVGWEHSHLWAHTH